ncbi:hypothetical protein A5788_12455 [Gordonia sp. 852002-50816_SCH5313054-c]|nr:hypothetical protein A5785_02220 [Gordonia sp. 852002-50395_SCH5434458]OBC10643.1 hypothetical protein A5786_04970 [Gordonia sp. 852002-50816_SCH5313054-a]OBC17321.1 hypothetical protein A5788_12455 [Gordonia sp. 852002-50816_SCH5313054-c]
MIVPLEIGHEGDENRQVTTVVLYEPGVLRDYSEALVLVSTPIRNQFELLSILHETRTSAAIIVPPDTSIDRSITSLQQLDGVPILRRSRWTGWTELFRAMIRLVDAGRIEAPAPRVDTLQELARWISTSSSTAVTIEDRQSRVLAYAVESGEVDSIRNQTILRGAVPEWRVEHLMATGFLPAVWRSDDVVVREAGDGEPARMVIALRSQDEVLGTIWSTLDMDTDRSSLRRLLLETKQTATAMLLREILHAQYELRLRESALAAALTTGLGEEIAAAPLGLRPTDRHSVVALGEDTELSRKIMFHMQAFRDGVRSASIGSALFTVVPLDETEQDAEDVASMLSERLSRVVGVGSYVIAVGAATAALSELPASATEARQIREASALRPTSDLEPPRPVMLTASSVSDELALIRAAEQLAPLASELTSPLQVLRDHDAEHGTQFIATVSASLLHPGNLAEASRTLGIHANSMRYRLQRINALASLDLQSATARLRAALALLVWHESLGARLPPNTSDSHKLGRRS